MEGTNLYKEELIAGFRCKYFDTVASTNDYAKSILDEIIAYMPAAIIANYQTEGKGQMGNHWESEAGKNLLLTAILKPNFSLSEALFRINYIMTYSVICTLRSVFSMPAMLKWPNDIYLEDKKIAGVLSETTIAGEKINTVIGGIGLNVNQNFKDVNSNYSAISMRDYAGKEFDLQHVTEEFLKTLREVTEKTAFTSLNFLEEKISQFLWNRNTPQEFVERDTNKRILASPDKFCSDHRLLVKHNGIFKKLTRESYQWLP
ncbi:MAG: biotin--[acetyl-CoA-carboxylase] ligase [Bacteroidetes bacterium]|nr:biotin--[acetyl-CoA-carboxylase] ligase [Bacteroidota bacterium]